MPSRCFSPDCVVMETRPLAFSPPGIHGSRVQNLGKSRGSHLPAAPRAEPRHGPARQLPVGCQGVRAVRNHQFLTLCVSLGSLGLLPGQEMLQHPRGKALPAPSNFLGQARCTKGSVSGAGAGNSSDGFLGKPLRDCRPCRRRNGNRNSGLSARCLSKIGTFWVSAFPRPSAVDEVTQLCLLPAPAAAS